MPTRFIPLVFVVLWATGFIFSKLAMPFAEPFTFLTIRFSSALILLVGIAFATGAPWPSRREALHAAIAGMLIHAAYLGPVFWAIKQGMSAGVNALIVSMQPILTAIVATALLRERVAARAWAGLVLGMAGVGLVLLPKLLTGNIDARADTLLASVIGLLGITLGNIYQKRFATGLDLRTGGVCQFLGASSVTGALALATETGHITLSPQLMIALAWSVLVLSLGAITLLMIMIRQGAISKVAAYFYLVPPVTALMAWGLFDERLEPIQLAGMALACLAVMLVSRSATSLDRPRR